MDRMILHAWIWSTTLAALWLELGIGRFGVELPCTAILIFCASMIWGGRRLALVSIVAGAVLDAVLGRTPGTDMIALGFMAAAGNLWRESLHMQAPIGLAILGFIHGLLYLLWVAAVQNLSRLALPGTAAALAQAVLPAIVAAAILAPAFHGLLAAGARRLGIINPEEEERRHLLRGHAG